MVGDFYMCPLKARLEHMLQTTDEAAIVGYELNRKAMGMCRGL